VIIVNSKLLLVFLEQLCDTSGQEMYPVSEWNETTETGKSHSFPETFTPKCLCTNLGDERLP
jgi:hypothetical protein